MTFEDWYHDVDAAISKKTRILRLSVHNVPAPYLKYHTENMTPDEAATAALKLCGVLNHEQLGDNE